MDERRPAALGPAALTAAQSLAGLLLGIRSTCGGFGAAGNVGKCRHSRRPWAQFPFSRNFAPTKWAAENLLREGTRRSAIYITGNTGIDAVLGVAHRVAEKWYEHHPGRVMLLTTHRRENWGEPQMRIARASRQIVDCFPDLLLVVAMHRNPDVRAVLTEVLGGHPRIELIEPPEYAAFVKLMERSHLILTDSGGVQEEAPAFGKPVLVLRENTERPEGVDAGTAKLVGTDEQAIVAEATKLLGNTNAYRQMAQAVSPYGDGLASQRIRCVVLQFLGVSSQSVPMWGGT